MLTKPLYEYQKKQKKALEAEYEVLSAKMLQWRFARVRAEAAFAGRERAALAALEPLWQVLNSASLIALRLRVVSALRLLRSSRSGRSLIKALLRRY
jgi:phage-related minor tail protein